MELFEECGCGKDRSCPHCGGTGEIAIKSMVWRSKRKNKRRGVVRKKIRQYQKDNGGILNMIKDFFR